MSEEENTPETPPGLPPEVRASLDGAQAAPPPADEEKAEENKIPEKVQLGGGHFVVFRQPSELRAKHTREAMRAMSADGTFGFAEALLPYVIKEWTLQDEYGRPLPLPSPTNREPLGEITSAEFMMLVGTALMYMPLIMPDTAFSEYRKSFESPTNASGD